MLQILNTKTDRAQLIAELNFIDAESKDLQRLVAIMESDTPNILTAYNVMQKLSEDFRIKVNAYRRVTASYLEDESIEGSLSALQSDAIQKNMQSAYKSIHLKLDKYTKVNGKQPGIKFIRQMRIADPRNISLVSKNYDAYKKLPGFVSVNEIEFERYVTCLGPEAVQNIKEGDGAQSFSPADFWSSMSSADKLPTLSKYFQSRIHFVCSSAAVERSFSQFNDISSSKRRSLMEKSMAELLFLYYNKL